MISGFFGIAQKLHFFFSRKLSFMIGKEKVGFPGKEQQVGVVEVGGVDRYAGR